MLWTLVGAARLVLAFPVLLFGLVVCPFIGLMPRPLFQGIARVWYRCLLFILGVRYRYSGEAIDQTCLMVSNHISWADILILGARYPFVFLAMREVASWPVVGWLARKAGTLFIRRGQGGDDAITQVSEALGAGESVTIFPEGRTTVGVTTSRFHAKIFEAAVIAGVPVRPVALFYRDAGQGADAGSRISFADEVGFIGGIWRTVTGPTVHASVHVFPALEPGIGRHELASAASAQIREKVEFTANSSDSGETRG